MSTYKLYPKNIKAGVQPSTDATNQQSQHWVYADKIRFVDGRPEKIGGYDTISFDNSRTIEGCILGLFSIKIGNNIWRIICTDKKVYILLGTELTNLTPLVVSTTALPSNPVNTFSPTLGSNPIATTSGSKDIVITETGHIREEGDSITLAGATTTNGIPNSEINDTHLIRSTTTNTYTLTMPSTSATSTGSGGGGSITVAGLVVQITDTGHGFVDGDRVKLALLTATGGVPAANLNQEHIIRNSQTNTYDILVPTEATSTATGGGANGTRQGEIADGECDASFGRGYGMGKYGVGLYGVSKTSTNLLTLPRVWNFARFGNLALLGEGNNGNIYSWDGDDDFVPAIITNAPTGDYVFVDKNIIVVLNANGVDGRIKWGDQGELTDWTPTEENFAGEDDIEGADKFVSHVNVRGVNILWTATQTYTFRYIDRPLVWATQQIDPRVGIIGQNARTTYKGIAYWMDKDDFYFYNGGIVQPMRGNGDFGQNTVKHYVYNDINLDQGSKFFAWVNKQYHEVWFHYCSSGSTSCDRVARYNTQENTWTIDTWDRSSAEHPVALSQFPFMGDENSMVYRHERGVDADTSPLAWELHEPFRYFDGDYVQMVGILPDSIQTGDITMDIYTKGYPQSTEVLSATETVTPTTEQISFSSQGRFIQNRYSQSVLGGNFRAGNWLEKLQRGTKE